MRSFFFRLAYICHEQCLYVTLGKISATTSGRLYKKKKGKYLQLKGKKKVKQMQELHKTKYKLKYTLCLSDIMKNNL